MSEPKPEDVDTFCAVTSASPSVAAQFLRKFPNAETAIGQYFDNSGILPQEQPEGWDESAFHTERDPQHGPENRPQASELPCDPDGNYALHILMIAAFNIQGADALNTGVFDPTPSRPPSRVSNQAVYDMHVWQQGLSEAAGQNAPNQESGITDAPGQRFRRTEDDYYDTRNWAVTVPRFETKEFLQEPAAKHRVRQESAPAFLKPAMAAQYLPAMLTILHTIPMAREALLARDISLADYGTNSDWWDGDSIQGSRVVVLDQPQDVPEGSDLIHEVQRLMAFLDMTDRAYGSVNNLMRERTVSNVYDGIAANFLRAWRQAMTEAKSTANLSHIFTSVAVNDPQEAANGSDAMAELTEFDVPVTLRVSELGGTLYDAIDDMVWTEADDIDPLLNVHVRFSDLVSVRIHNKRREVSGIGLEIPLEFYPDRYMESFVETMKPVREQRIKLLCEISRVSDTLRDMATVQDPLDYTRVYSGIELLDKTILHLLQSPDRQSAVEMAQARDTLVDVDDTPREFSYTQLADELKSTLYRLGQKHKELQKTKERLTTELLAATAPFRDRKTHTDPSNLHRYTLRGISTDPSTTYVLIEPPASPSEELVDFSPPSQAQWWKLGYDGNSETPVISVRTTEAEVLSAAQTEANEIMLVYASDTAMQYPCEPLPSRLRNFARADNLAFAREQEQAEAAGATEGGAGGGGGGGGWGDDRARGWDEGRDEGETRGWDAWPEDDKRAKRAPPGTMDPYAMHKGHAEWIESGRQTPVNITISDDGIDGIDGEPPPYDAAGAPDVAMGDVASIEDPGKETSGAGGGGPDVQRQDVQGQQIDLLGSNYEDEDEPHPLYRTGTHGSARAAAAGASALLASNRQMDGLEQAERKGG